GQEERSVGTKRQLPVPRAVPARDRTRPGELVERRFLESDRERADGLTALLGREGGERTGVDAAREQHADGDVRDEMGEDGIAQPRPALFDELGLVCVVARSQRAWTREAPKLELTLAPREQVAGRELADLAEDRQRRGDRV